MCGTQRESEMSLYWRMRDCINSEQDGAAKEVIYYMVRER